MLPPKILKIARAVRRWAEKFVKTDMRMGQKDLCGMCAISSALLLKKIREAGYTGFKIVSGDNHAYLLYNNEIVLDCTATQFGYTDKVLVCHKSELKFSVYHYFYNTYTSHDNEIDFVKYQLEAKWPIYQTARWLLKE